MNSKISTPTLYLIDISSLFFRSYYAISLNMKNEKGQPTNAIYGVLKMIQQLSKNKQPAYMICCFDTKFPSFRKKLYSQYKANREQMPEDLEVQVPYLKTMMKKMLIPSWEQPGFEADDLIATLTLFAKKKQWKTYIVSGDKDFSQLVDANVYLYDTMKDVIYDPCGVEEKWGLPPSQMQDYLSLVGDASDNIPGVKGIGPKGATQLLKTYGSLKDVYKNTDKIKDSIKDKLLKSKKMAFLSQDLIALKQDIPYDKKLFVKHQAVSNFSQKDKESLKLFLEELNFKSFLKSFFPSKTESPKPEKNTWTQSKSSSKKLTPSAKSDFSSLPSLQNLKLNKVTLEDFKKTLPPYAQIWIGMHDDQYYLSYGRGFVILNKTQLREMAEFLDYKWVRYLGHDLKLLWKDLKPEHLVAHWDSLIAGHLLYSMPEPSLRKLFNLVFKIPEDAKLSLSQVIFYEQKLQDQFLHQLEQEGMTSLFKEIELPLIAVLHEIESHGFLIDLTEAKKQSKELGQDILNLELQIHKLAGEKFNISSPKQLGKILFEKLQLPKGRKIKTGYSTDSYELMKIKDLHPILCHILEYKELFKLKSTYTDSLISLRDQKTGRVYTKFKQALAVTGRLSSVNPNLQNIPIRTPRGRMVRKIFTVPSTHKLICADYSQVELRILAHITKDPNLCKAFKEGLDIHAITASELFNVPLKDVSFDLRRKSKAVNFGIAYGQGAYGLAESLSIPRTQAKEIIDRYFKTFKKIKDYIETVKEELPTKKYVKTLYGRKRYFNTEDLRHPRLKAALERAAINAPLQGTASDLVKKAMISLNESLPIPILSQVHDELLFECPKEYVERESKEIIPIMENNDVLNIPLKLKLSFGDHWFAAHS